MYRVTTSHTFTSHTLEDQTFSSPEDAWRAAAEDYATTDAGMDRDAQDTDAERMALLSAPGTYRTTEGEEITVHGPLTVQITRVRYRAAEVHDGEIPREAYESANTETIRCDSWADAVRALRDAGCTEWSSYPPEWNGGHGWFSSPDGSVQVYGGDMYDPGYDQEETSARISGRGAYRAWFELTHGTADASMFRRSPHPVLGGEVADSWDGADPFGSAMLALGGIADVLFCLDPNAIPAEWGFRPALGATQDLDTLVEDGDYPSAAFADGVRDGRYGEADLISAGNVLSRFIDCLPEDRKY